MKLLHTSDWHLGKRLDSFSRLNEQKEVMEEICRIADREKVDAVLVAGDLFDTFNPATEAVELFYKTLKKLSANGTRAVIAIAGNHDSPDRIEAPDPLARENGIIFSGYPHTEIPSFSLETGVKLLRSEAGFIELKLPGHDYPLRLIVTPYANEYRLKTFLGIEDSEAELRSLLANRWQQLADRYCDTNGVNLLLTHLFFMKKGTIPQEEPEDEKPILHVGGAQAIFPENIPPQIQYTAVGHLHRKQEIDSLPCPIVYSSSPLAYSFGEANQDKYVVIVEVEPDVPAIWRPVQLNGGKRLLRKKFDDLDKAISWLQENQNSLVELTLVTDQFLTAEERRKIHHAHEGIVAIIPEIRNQNLSGMETERHIDLSQDIEPLFSQYFKHKHGQTPNQEILQLFKEVIAQENEE